MKPLSVNQMIFVLIMSFFMTGVMFFIASDVDRLKVQKEFSSPYLSPTVEGRGWPIAYFLDDPTKPGFENIDFQDRFFPGAFLADWVIFSVAVGTVFFFLNSWE